MRICFPSKEQEDTLVGVGEIRIGAAEDNTIVVGGDGVAAHHLVLKLSDRCIELAVRAPQARTHVNTRPVREKAILRFGDLVSLGAVQLVLKPDRDTDVRTDIPSVAAARPSEVSKSLPPILLLRGLSGMHFGKIFPVRDRLLVGRQGELALDMPDAEARHASIELAGDVIVLRSLGAAVSAQVNGVDVSDAILMGGDQICFGRERFLVETPSLPQRLLSNGGRSSRMDPSITRTMPAISLPGEERFDDRVGIVGGESPANKNDIWWLIVVAALIAAGLTVFFLGII